jgi:hypothetical protein
VVKLARNLRARPSPTLAIPGHGRAAFTSENCQRWRVGPAI